MRKTVAGLFGAAVLCVAVAPAHASTLYAQPFDGTGNAYSSPNDTTGGNGNFATVYDTFTLGANSAIHNVQWVGEFFNPVEHGQITAFTLAFYDDNGGIPGQAIFLECAGGNANETDIGNYKGYEAYEYSLNIAAPLHLAAGTQYWVSVEPDLGFPPQWGWSTSASGNGMGYQCFFGSCGGLGVNLAFKLNGRSRLGSDFASADSVSPEPGSLFLLGSGLLMFGGYMRRKLGR